MLGFLDGAAVGSDDGAVDGVAVGSDDGNVDGNNEGATVGSCDGTLDGNRDDTALGLLSSPTTDTPTATPSTLSTRMITNDDFIQAAQVGDLQRLKELVAEWKVTGYFDINATNEVSL